MAASDDPPSVRLLLIRHGQAGGPGVPYGSGVPLTEFGKRQATHLAEALAERDVWRVVSSPFARARNTAQATADRLGQALELDGRLAEFQPEDDIGVPIEQLFSEKTYLKIWKPHHSLTEGGETLRGFQERVSAALSDLGRSGDAVADERAVSIAVFTHGGTIAAAMRWAYGLTPEHDWHADVEIHNASITEIEHWPSGRHAEGAPHSNALHRLNDVRHLPPDLVTDY